MQRAFRSALRAATIAMPLIVGAFAAMAAAPTQRFVVASDIHFDPFYDPTLVSTLAATDPQGWDAVFATSTKTELGRYGIDTPWPLLTSAFQAMRAAEPSPAFVLVSGDVLAHHFQDLFDAAMPSAGEAAYQGFAARTVAYVAQKLQETYPDVSIVVALGNNDDDCGDYRIQPGGAFLAATRATIADLLRGRTGPDFASTWDGLGNFVVPHPTLPGVRIASVNTVYLTPKYTNACGDGATADPATATLDWLSQVLAEAQAAGEKVWLLQHVPPGIDAYSTTKHGSCSGVVPMYAPRYQPVYFPLMRKYSRVIAASFSGHTHMDDFRLIGSGVDGSYTLITPAISPIFGQNPGFRIFEMGDDGALLDQSTHYLSNLATAGPDTPAAWGQEYAFNDAWQVSGVNVATLQAIHARIAAGAVAEGQYIAFYGVSTAGDVGIDAGNETAYVCAAGAAETAAFTACYCPSGGSPVTAR